MSDTKGMLLMGTPTAGRCNRAEAFATDLIPEATRSYQPFSNEELVLMINKVAKMYGMNLIDERMGMDLKGMRFFGVYTVEGFDFFGGRIRLTVGFCNSYNKSMSGRMCIGGDVMVCSNSAFYAYTDKETGINGMAMAEHRPGIHDGLFQRIDAAFAGIEQFRKRQELFYGHLEERQITVEEAHHMIIKAAQQGVVNKTRILKVAEEWNWQERGPENEVEERERIWHPEFKPRNAYNLFQAFTEVQKDRMAVNPVQTNIQTLGLTEFFYTEYNKS
jgi:hypothetical protein